MKWSSIDPRDGWRDRFALLPVKIGDEWVWLERYQRRFMGDCYEVRTALTPTDTGEQGKAPLDRQRDSA